MGILSKLDFYFNSAYKTTFSLEGEDIILFRLFDRLGIKKGFYLDIGCNHPRRYNNTYRLYKKGWRGICIDPNPYRILYSLFRPKDIYSQCVMGSKDFNINRLYKHKESSLNSLVDKTERYEPVQEQTLDHIIDLYHIDKIDLLDIDIQGYEKIVLESYSWKVHPKVISIELTHRCNKGLEDLIISKGYEQIASTMTTTIFIKKGI